MQFDEVLRSWKQFFESEGIRYALIGGLAVRVWGRARLTKDMDIAVDRSRREVVIAHAENLGYETLFVSEAYSNHLHADERLGRVDFMYLSGETAERVFRAATEQLALGDESAVVASPTHLAMMKAISMKNAPHRTLFEGEDVRVLLNQPGVDLDQVREFYARHGLLDLFDAILKAR